MHLGCVGSSVGFCVLVEVSLGLVVAVLAALAALVALAVFATSAASAASAALLTPPLSFM